MASESKQQATTLYSSSGLRIESQGEETERAVLRKKEDQDFVPVIVKRMDEVRTHPDDILERAIREGHEQVKRGGFSLFLSSLAAGLILGFVAMAVGVVATYGAEVELSPLARRLAQALVYPFGFVVCILSGTQLFTEHTATAVYPVLEAKASVPRLLRLWAIVICGNLIGAALISLMLSSAEDVIGASEGYILVAEHLLAPTSIGVLLSSVLAGWLMAQGAWLAIGSPSRTAQIICIYIVTFLIGVGGLHHSIAGSAELFTAWLVANDIDFSLVAKVVGISLCGNLLGGSLFVAILNYAHIRQTQSKRRMA